MKFFFIFRSFGGFNIDFSGNPDFLVRERIIRPHVHRLPTRDGGDRLYNELGPRRLNDKCQKEIYLCLLHILTTINEIQLKLLFQSWSIQDRLHFFTILK